MTAHTVIARLGHNDIETITPTLSDSHVAEINFIDSYDRLDFGLGQAPDKRVW